MIKSQKHSAKQDINHITYCQILSKLPDKSNVLEVGCGNGKLLR